MNEEMKIKEMLRKDKEDLVHGDALFIKKSQQIVLTVRLWWICIDLATFDCY